MENKRWTRIFKAKPGEPLRAWIFTLILVATCVYLLLHTSSEAFNWYVLVFMLLVAVAESTPVTLPHAGQGVSVGFAIVYATLILFNPSWAAVAAGGGVVIAHMLQKRLLNIWLFNGAQIYLASFCASAVYHALADPVGGPGVLYQAVPYLFLAALTYFALNIMFSTVSVSLAFRLPLRELLIGNVKWAIPNVVVLWTVGILMVYLFLSDAGILGIVILWLPLLVVRYSFRQYVELKQTHIGTIQSLAAALDAKDPYTRGHSQRVADMASQVARALKMPDDQVEAVHYAGLLHDIGKIGVQDDVLNKAGKLTDEDWIKIRSHATIGADIVKQVRFLSGVSEMIRHHHESYDGAGYPSGLKGEHIPLGARILAVCDAYDAMTTERPYRKALSRHEAVGELKRKAGVQFDPHVVEVFLSEVGVTEDGSAPTLPYTTDGTEVQAQ